jgi:hypothetical protein
VIIDHSGFSFIEYKPINLTQKEEPTACPPLPFIVKPIPIRKMHSHYAKTQFQNAKKALKYAPNCYQTADNQGY